VVAVDVEGEIGGVDAVIVDRVEYFKGVMMDGKGVIVMPSLTWVFTAGFFELVCGVRLTPIIAAIVFYLFFFIVGPRGTCASLEGGLHTGKVVGAQGTVKDGKAPSDL
jgi:hypothetical protein